MDWFVINGEPSKPEPVSINMIRDKIALSQRVVQLLYMPKLHDQAQVVSFLFFSISEVIKLYASLSPEG
jgi:hypothetical protein